MFTVIQKIINCNDLEDVFKLQSKVQNGQNQPLKPTVLTAKNKLRGSGTKTEKTIIVNRKSSYSHVHSIAHDNNGTNKHVNGVMGERKKLTVSEVAEWAPPPPSFPLPLFSLCSMTQNRGPVLAELTRKVNCKTCENLNKFCEVRLFSTLKH